MKGASENQFQVKSPAAFLYLLQVTYLTHNLPPKTYSVQQNTKEAPLGLTFA
jgi:hypothetical protein